MDKYEKLYNEALERARKIHNEILDNELLGFPDQIREIFPELRESEDERIRKWLVDYFSSIKATVWIHRDISCEQILDWLEKQKENPKNADSIPADCALNAKCEDRWHKTANYLPDDGRDVLAKDALGNYLLASFDGAQWFVSVYDGEDHPVLHTPPILEWCEIPSEKQKEQNKCPEFCSGHCVGCEQKEQKPAEWSEEDQLNLNWVIAILNGEPCDLDIQLESLISWLKSLRPSWKPSEEQMDALKELIDDANRAGWVTPGATELYEQLKNL